MIHRKVVLVRPSVDTPFFQPSDEQQRHLQQQYVERGLLSIEVTYSVDQLTKVTELKFANEHVMHAFDTDPLLLEQRAEAKEHNAAHGITARRQRPVSEAHLRLLQDRLITPEYLELNRRLHADDPDYGIGGFIWAGHVREVMRDVKGASLLDYGCGKRALEAELRRFGANYAINNYDPAVSECSSRPEPADVVACIDTLEHIEPDCLDAVLEDIRALSRKATFFAIALEPARRVLADGRNAHLIVRPGNWWLERLLRLYTVRHVHNFGGELVVIGSCT